MSRKACTAVGSVDKAHGAQATLAERWNGSRWAIEPTPTPSGLHDGYLDGVSCRSRHACTATGIYFKSHSGEAITERWNGSKWSIHKIARPVGPHGAKGGAYLTGVSCAASRACTVAGSASFPGALSSATLAEFWNGSRWSLQQTPNRSKALGSLFYGVSCIERQACWAVGESTMPSTSPYEPPTQVTLAERWDGSRWTIQHTPNPRVSEGSVLQAVSCRSTAACIAVGWSPSGLATIAEGWNGSRWTIQRTPSLSGASNGLFSVSCSSPTLCTAAGTSRGRPLIERHT